MDGVLLKWTNYFSGWQPRYFILEDGILSYYQSKADMNNSCKGSIKVSACDITAHPNDHTRMDIIVPGEACYYVKAATQQDRQMWLVALGTCKARSYNSAPRFPDSSSTANRNDECLAGEELLKMKKSELVMYRDLLTQQLYNIKMSLKTDKPPNIELLNEASALVNVTCESFIGTLDDCMQLVDLNSCLNSKEGSLSPISKSKQFSYKESSWGSQPMTRHVSLNDRRGPSSRSISEEKEMNPSIIHSRNRIVSESRSPSDHLQPINLTSPKPQPKLSPVPSFNPDLNDGVFTTDGSSVVNGYGDKSTSIGVRDLSPDRRLPTFFSRIKMSFLDVQLTSEMEIPTIPFLDACKSVVSIFDKLNEQAFVIGKLDIAGNIRKIHQKYISSPESFPTIQQMVTMEIIRKENENINSATVALLWLCKSLEFCTELMSRLLTYDCDVESEEMRKVVREVYEKVLKNHHGWVVRSAFYMILPSLPPLSQMISTLSVEPSHSENPNFKTSLKLDVIDYLSGLRSIVDMLHSFFDANKLTISDNTD